MRGKRIGSKKMGIEKTKDKRKKLIVIGIDGATFDIINPMFEKNLLGELKNFKHKAVLSSVTPPATCAAWGGFITGNLPGKTEIYDFTNVDDDSWKVNFIERKRLKGKTLWKYLDEAGLKSCFINMPLTFPPDKINGVMISGIDAPSELYNYVYPPKFKRKLKEIGYKIEISSSDKVEEKMKDALGILDKRIKTAEYFLKKDFDFFFVLFRASDILQHYSWDRGEIVIVYKKICNFIKGIRGKEILVMSDHGSEEIKKTFNVNNWLEKEGYLRIKSKRKKVSFMGINRELAYKILRRLKITFLVRLIPRKWSTKIPSKIVGFEEAISTGLIDLSKTKAIAKRAVKTAQIFINSERRKGIVKKEEEEKLKREIKEKLIRFLEQNKVKAIVQTKEELYGKDARYAPDLTVYLQEKGYDTNCLFLQNRELWSEPNTQNIAEHNLNGVIFTNLNLNLDGAQIIDLTPTILKYFKIKEGKFDGKSLL